jgi:hypothetical protein
MEELTGYHVTTEETAAIIMADYFKGSAWTDDIKALESMSSNPFELFEDGAVWCYPTLKAAQANLEDDEVIIEVWGEGYEINHEAHGRCVVLRADTCEDYEIVQ